MRAYKKEFIDLALELGVLRFGEFTLKSGRVSPYFFNAGLFNTGYAAARIGRFYAAAIAEAESDKEWTMAELMEKGRGLYNTKCAACHQVTGTGLPPAFPSLVGSPVVTGPIAGHLEVVLNGRPGTAMQAWNTLNNLEIAAIVTYQRNAWGNDTGDVIQTAQVESAR